MKLFKQDKFNLTQRVAYNALFSTAARVVEIVIGLLTIRLTSDYLGLALFGDYSTVMAFVSVFAIVGEFGLFSIVVREISLRPQEESRILSGAFTLRLVLGGAVLGSAYFFSYLFPYSTEVRNGIFILSVGYWISNLIQVLIGLFQKHLAMDKVAWAELWGRIAQLLAIAACVYFDWGFYAILGVWAFSSLFNLLLVWHYAGKFTRLGLNFDWILWKELLFKSSALVVSAILVYLYFKLDTVILSVFRSSEEVGIYGLAYKVLENLLFFPAMLVGLTMPMMSKFAGENREKFMAVAERTLHFLLLLIVPMVLGLIATAAKIIALLSKHAEFAPAEEPLRVLALALGIIFLGALFSNMIIALGQQKKLARIYAVGAIFNLTLNWLLIPRFSYMAAAWTTVLTEILVTVLMLLAVRSYLRLRACGGVLVKSLLSGAVMFAVLGALSHLHIFLLVPLGGAVYGSLTLLTGALSRQELDKLLQRKF